MDAELIAKKEALYAAEKELNNVLSNPGKTMKDGLAAYKAVEEAKAILEGRVIGGSGWAKFEAEVILRHASHYPANEVERAHEILGDKVEIWDGLEP